MPGSYRKYNRDNTLAAVSQAKESFGNSQQQCCLYGQRKWGWQGVSEVMISLPLSTGQASQLTYCWCWVALYYYFYASLLQETDKPCSNFLRLLSSWWFDPEPQTDTEASFSITCFYLTQISIRWKCSRVHGVNDISEDSRHFIDALILQGLHYAW